MALVVLNRLNGDRGVLRLDVWHHVAQEVQVEGEKREAVIDSRLFNIHKSPSDSLHKCRKVRSVIALLVHK